MDLTEFHHSDGRPVAFDRNTVILVEPHADGTGTLMRLGPGERTVDMHLREDYEVVMAELKLTFMERTMRNFLRNQEEQSAAASE